jgi:CTP synthase (UTP-ammonia lyase)
MLAQTRITNPTILSGGTVGDIENAPFIEALRQLRQRVGKGNFLHFHVSMIPVINDEQKTKPTQQAIRVVRSTGLLPDLVSLPEQIPTTLLNNQRSHAAAKINSSLPQSRKWQCSAKSIPIKSSLSPMSPQHTTSLWF